MQNCNIKDYIPEIRKKYPSRSWLCTVGTHHLFHAYLVNTLIESEFEKFIASQLEVREATILMNKRLEIKATNEFASMFKQSKYSSRTEH